MLLLDEPTNDLDIETLNVVEDFLDGWPGTLIVVSHDRYFLERVTDSVWALMGDGQIAMLPRGVDEYLERRRQNNLEQAATVKDAERARTVAALESRPGTARSRASIAAKAKVGGAEERSARKDDRPHRQAARPDHLARGGGDRRDGTNADAGRLKELSEEMHRLADERGQLEEEWLEAAALLE